MGLHNARELRPVEQSSVSDPIYDDFPYTGQVPPSDQDKAHPAPGPEFRFDTRDIATMALALAVTPVAALAAWMVADDGRTRRAMDQGEIHWVRLLGM